jgi:lipopolysaccharide biosynthesis glycosyltransferase
MIPIYTGFDPREEAGTHVFHSSVIERASEPVSFCPLHLPHLRQFYDAGQRDGSNAFIYTRFLIPHLQGHQGWALFVDGADMLCRADIAELWALRDEFKAVQVVQHCYDTRHPRKYIGTRMETANADYPRKNWSSVMLINCEHEAWAQITPDTVARMTGAALHRFSFISPGSIGALPMAWNWIADEYGHDPDAKLVHWTAGTPAFKHYANAPFADEFRAQLAKVNHVTD